MSFTVIWGLLILLGMWTVVEKQPAKFWAIVERVGLEHAVASMFFTTAIMSLVPALFVHSALKLCLK